VTPVPQDEARATYTQMTRKEDGAIDWNEPAVAIARRVRAYNPWPTAYTTWETRGVQLLRAHARDGEAAPGLVTGVERGALTIGTGRGLLGATEVQLAGSRPLAAETVLRGHPRLVGAVLGGGA
jgi:methionyl-tRNA formyltransferase